ITPKALPPGGTIAFLSPSARMHESHPLPTQRATQALEAQGYKVKTIHHPEDPATTTIASHIETRKQELLAAFADDSVHALVCMVGGTTLTELVPALLHDQAALRLIRAHPKILVGYSDITILHWLLYTQCGLRTFYGPTVVPELGEAPRPDPYSLRHLLDAIARPHQPVGTIRPAASWRTANPAYFADPASLAPAPYAPNPGWTWLRPGRAEGRIFGGCLSLVVRLGGVRQLNPDWHGRVVFLETAMAESDEDKGVPVERIRSQLADLVAQGIFDRVAGVVFGRFFGYGDEQGRKVVEKLVREVLVENEWVRNEKFGAFPVLMGVDFGHTSPMITIPMDATVKLDSEQDAFEILEPGVL
ncbi:peptidase S66, LD-carboxypeptidase A, partial [Cryphonectria parasitica EP155]